MSTRKQRCLASGLFLFYLFVLVWIILFKLSFSVQDLPHLRSVNLIPFAGSTIVNGAIQTSEILDNILIFIPFGVYLCLLKVDWPLWKKLLPIFLTSLALELLQFLFSLGASDITDLLGNTLGGLLGIGTFQLFSRLFQDKCRKIILSLALVGTLLMSALISLLIIAN